MVNNTIHATYTETYDLNTAINELSLLAVHTPQANALKMHFKGFFENYKKYKIVACNIGMVCASQQSLTPSEVGLEAGQVDPRDVLNPILFKACTGENLNEILNQIYGNTGIVTDASSLGQHIDSSIPATNMYYQMLSDDSWRKEHPQRGLFVSGLKPYVHKIVTTQPFRWTGASTAEWHDNPNIIGNPNTGQAPSVGTPNDYVAGFGSPGGNAMSYPYEKLNTPNPTVFISDGITDMPWLDTTFDGSIPDGEGGYVKSQRLIVSVPRVFCGCIILPPAILQRLFFRMQISWHIMFKDFRPAYEIGTVAGNGPYDPNRFDGDRVGNGGVYNPTYWNIYHDASTKLDKEFSSFDVNGEAEVTQVMESVN